jgi:hypothetical protein
MPGLACGVHGAGRADGWQRALVAMQMDECPGLFI